MALRKKLGEILVEQGATTPDDVKRALGHQRQWGGRTGRILVDMGAIGEDQLTRALAVQSRMPTAKLKPTLEREIAGLVPLDLAEKHQALAFGVRRSDATETVYIAVADPYDIAGMDAVRFRIGKPVKFALAPANEIARLINQSLKGGAIDPPSVEPVSMQASTVPAVDPLEELGRAIASAPAASNDLDELLGLAPPSPSRTSDELDALLGAPSAPPAASILDDLFGPSEEPAHAPPAPSAPAATGIAVTRFTPKAKPAAPAAPVAPTFVPPTLTPAVVTGTLVADPEPAPLFELGTEDIAESPTAELELSLDEAEQPAESQQTEGSRPLELALAAEQAASLGTVETAAGIELPTHADETLELEEPDALRGGWTAATSEEVHSPEATPPELAAAQVGAAPVDAAEPVAEADPTGWFANQDGDAVAPDDATSLFGEAGQDFSAGADGADLAADGAQHAGFDAALPAEAPEADVSATAVAAGFDGWSDAAAEASEAPAVTETESPATDPGILEAALGDDASTALPPHESQPFDTEDVLAGLQESEGPVEANAPPEPDAPRSEHGEAPLDIGAEASGSDLAASELAPAEADAASFAATSEADSGTADLGAWSETSEGTGAPSVEPASPSGELGLADDEEIEVDVDLDESTDSAFEGEATSTELASDVPDAPSEPVSESLEPGLEGAFDAPEPAAEQDVAATPPALAEASSADADEGTHAAEDPAASASSFDAWELTAPEAVDEAGTALAPAAPTIDPAVDDVFASLEAPVSVEQQQGEPTASVEEVPELAFDAPFDVVEDAESGGESNESEPSPSGGLEPFAVEASIAAPEAELPPTELDEDEFEPAEDEEGASLEGSPDVGTDVSDEAPPDELSSVAWSEETPGFAPSVASEAYAESAPEIEPAPAAQAGELLAEGAAAELGATGIAESDAPTAAPVVEESFAAEASEASSAELVAANVSEPTAVAEEPVDEAAPAAELAASIVSEPTAVAEEPVDEAAPAAELAASIGLEPTAVAEEPVDEAAPAAELVASIASERGVESVLESHSATVAPAMVPPEPPAASTLLLEALVRLASGAPTEEDRTTLPPERLAAAALLVLCERGWITAEELASKMK